MTFSLFDHPHFSALLGHDEIAPLFKAEAEMAAMLRFETALAEVECELGVIPEAACAAILAAIAAFKPALERLAAAVGRDGLVVPELVAALREELDDEHRAHVHFGATSQDVIDTGLILRVKKVMAVLRRDLAELIGTLEQLRRSDGMTPVMGRTRMQCALPITAGDRIATWASPLQQHLETLDTLERRVLVVQFGGAVGTLDKLEKRGAEVRAALAGRLGLVDPGRSWHAERDRIADLAGWLSKVSGSVGKIGQDLVLMAQNEVGEAVLASGGLSSAMPHKRNPVQAEILVTLARFNAGQLSSVHQALVHEGERSGAAWTLEWMVLPEMVAATAASLKLCGQCLESLEIRGSG